MAESEGEGGGPTSAKTYALAIVGLILVVVLLGSVASAWSSHATPAKVSIKVAADTPNGFLISGQVTDAKGDGIGGVPVYLATPAGLSTTTDGSGLYAFHNIALTPNVPFYVTVHGASGPIDSDRVTRGAS